MDRLARAGRRRGRHGAQHRVGRRADRARRAGGRRRRDRAAGRVRARPGRRRRPPAERGQRLVETARYAGATLGPPLGGVLAATGRIEHRAVGRRRHVPRRRRRRAAAARPPPAGARRGRPRARPRGVLGADGRPGPARHARDGGRRTAVLLDVDHRRGLLRQGRARAPATRSSACCSRAGRSGWSLGAVGLARRVPTGALAVAALAAVAIQGAGLGHRGRRHAVRPRSRASRSAASPTASRTCSLRTLIHERVPETVRGRAFARLQRRPQRRRAQRAGARRRARSARSAPRPALLLSGAIPLAIGLAALLFITTPTRRTADVYDG